MAAALTDGALSDGALTDGALADPALADPALPDREPADGTLLITRTTRPLGLVIAGDIDEFSYADPTAALSDFAAEPGEVHIDLANVRYCDLAGLRAIVRLTLADNRGPDHGGRRVTVHDMPEHLSDILRILGWDATPGLVLAER